VTELLLQDLRDAHPPGTWRLWGEPDRIRPWLFAGASIVEWHGRPQLWFGQADLLRVPPHDVAIYLHQVRPLRPGRSIAFVHDTIPLHHAPHRLIRAGKWLFFALVCRLSDRVITVSEQSREAIVQDLRVPRRKILVANLGVDAARIARIRALRAATARQEQLLYVGRFARHKNLQRLCQAFQRTTLHREGGTLILAGGSPAEVQRMTAWAEQEELTGLDVRGRCSEAELDALVASCRVVVQPSLEEGYGLPAVEAAAVGVQVAASRTGAATAIPDELVTFLDPLDEGSITAAIDRAAAKTDAATEWLPRSTLGVTVLGALRDVSSSRR
jgi:glycosyltransferase involved in cell wall biosynthesis